MTGVACILFESATNSVSFAYAMPLRAPEPCRSSSVLGVKRRLADHQPGACPVAKFCAAAPPRRVGKRKYTSCGIWKIASLWPI